jgi:hypothetical protein
VARLLQDIRQGERPKKPTLDPLEGRMNTPLLQTCLVAVVTLGLYAFYCYWEAGRADLAASFRHLVPGLPGMPRSALGATHRTRGRWAAAGAVLLGLGCVASLL